MRRTQPRHQPRGHRQRGRHAGQQQRPAGRGPRLAQLLAQRLALVQHAVRAGQHPLTLGRQALVLAAAAHDGHAELLLERADRVRQRRLGDVAGLGGAAEVARLRQRAEVAHRVEQIHGAILRAGLPLRVSPDARMYRNAIVGDQIERTGSP